MGATRKLRSRSKSGSKSPASNSRAVANSSAIVNNNSRAVANSSAAANGPTIVANSSAAAIKPVVVEPVVTSTAIVEAPLNLSVRAKTRKLLNSRALGSRMKRKELGKGTFGRVNEEEVISRGILVATKYPLRQDLIKENINEIAAMKYLEGLPHVSQFLGTSNQNTKGACVIFPCIVMEAAKNNLDKIPYPNWDYVFKTVVGVLKGYDTLHSAYIVHRDTKPRNMLMSTTDEVLITDFGTCRYMPPNMPPCQDAYPGTYLYAAPELLIKRYMAPRSFSSWEGWYASDAWAVGVSLYQIVVGMPLFTDADVSKAFKKDHQLHGKTALHVLIDIYSKLGAPIEKDGEMFLADNQFTKQIGTSISDRTKEVFSFATLARDPTIIYDMVIERARFKTNPEQIKLVAKIIQRLVDYNPETRLTIRGALKLILKAGYIKPDDLAPKYDKDLFEQYLLPVHLMTDTGALSSSSSSSSSVVSAELPSWAITKNDIVLTIKWLASFKWSLSKESIYFVFDRAFLIFMASLRHLHHKLSKKNIQIVGLVSVVIAAFLFDSAGRGLSLEKAISMRTNVKHRFSTLYNYIKYIVLTDIQFYGTTFYDLLVEEVEIERANKINMLCYTYCLYSDFLSKAKPSEVSEFLLEFGKGDEEITQKNMIAAFNAYNS